MQVSEIFYSIQGEGPNIGKPAIFLRLAGCNLRCSWCDSKFTWEMNSGSQISISDILKEIQKYPCNHLVITGGEPLLQQDELAQLLPKLKSYFIEIETNGTVKPKLKVDQYNCSPKTTNPQKFPKNTFYKFVVNKKSDLTRIKSIISRHRIPKDQVLLMPQGINKLELAKRSKWLIELCKLENLRFCPRLHINIWGNKRKV